MTDREKVIRGLECCAAMSGDECRECPYSKECLDADLPYGMPHLAADALALLKAQEPRVMALEDVRELHANDVVWLEDIDKDIVIPGICCGVKKVCTDFTQFLTRDPIRPYVFLIHNEYGQRKRCWTSRPTDAQREAASWSD